MKSLKRIFILTLIYLNSSFGSPLCSPNLSAADIIVKGNIQNKKLLPDTIKSIENKHDIYMMIKLEIKIDSILKGRELLIDTIKISNVINIHSLIYYCSYVNLCDGSGHIGIFDAETNENKEFHNYISKFKKHHKFRYLFQYCAEFYGEVTVDDIDDLELDD
jgi:hypothetical protein